MLPVIIVSLTVVSFIVVGPSRITNLVFLPFAFLRFRSQSLLFSVSTLLSTLSCHEGYGQRNAIGAFAQG